MIKQVIVMRNDLNMRKGKMCAQAAHASMKVFFDRGNISSFNKLLMTIKLTPKMGEWIKNKFTKVVVKTSRTLDGEQIVRDLEKQAKESSIPCAVIVDSGKTEFDGVPTVTCIAIGPDEAEKIDKLTGGFSLL